MKKIILLFAFVAFTFSGLFAITHGSIIKKNAPLNVAAGSFDGHIFPANAVVDFRAVALGGKLWAKVVGTGYQLNTNPWSSQIRIYYDNDPLRKPHEISKNNDPSYIEVDLATNTTIVTAYPYLLLSMISVCQDELNTFNQTEIWNFDVNSPNSGLTGDTEKPLLTSVEFGDQDGTTMPVSCTASDNSGDYFYIITDEANNFSYASFTDNFTITGLGPGITYTFNVVAVDFSGNESVGITTNVESQLPNHGSIIKKDAPLDIIVDNQWATGEGFSPDAKVNVKAITFAGKLWAEIVGTGYTLGANKWSSQLRIYVPQKHEISKDNDPNYITVDTETRTTVVTAYPFTAISQISVCQGNNYEWFNGTEIWNYDAFSVNSGLTGDTQKPLLTSVQLGSQDGTTMSVSCTASDNSGDYFYLISDVVNGFYYASLTDDFTITGLDPAKTYTLSVVAVDFSGNESVGVTTSVYSQDNNKVTLSQNENAIVINSPEQIGAVKLYSINGQQIRSQFFSNTLVTSNLAKGVYVLKVQDIQGGINKFKVIIK